MEGRRQSNTTRVDTVTEEDKEESGGPDQGTTEGSQQETGNNDTTTRSGRVSRPPKRFDEYQMHLQTQAHPDTCTCKYTTEEAKVMTKILQHFEAKINTINENRKMQFAQTYSIKTALKNSSQQGRKQL